MRASDEAMTALIESLAAEVGAGAEFELELGTLVGKYRAKFDKAMRDKRAADLLPLGRMVAAERLQVAPSTVYKMVHRFRRLSTPTEAA